MTHPRAGAFGPPPPPRVAGRAIVFAITAGRGWLTPPASDIVLNTVGPVRCWPYISVMAKSPIKSWLPQRNASSGRFLTKKVANNAPRPAVTETVSNPGTVSGSVHLRSSVSGRISLPNGHSITTVRKDVMDRALGRGEFKKK